MIHLHDAILILNPQVVTIYGEEAFDKDNNPVAYDLEAAQAKLTELQAAEDTEKQTKIAVKESAIAKLSAIGLTEDEIKALIGN